MALPIPRPSFLLMILGLIFIFVGVVLLLAVGGVSFPPLSFVEFEALGMRIRIGDIPVETAAALWGGAFLVLLGVICVVMAFRT